MNDDCIYKPGCDMICKMACKRYVEMKFMLKHSNIPKSKQKINSLIPDECDLDAFEHLALIRDGIEDFVVSGGQLYIYSDNCGNGKTTWAVKLMLQYFHEKWPGNGFTERGIIIHVPTFLYKCKDVISHPDPEFEHLRDMLPKVDLVVWDEIASTKLSEYDYNTLLVIMNIRSFEEKANIFTGNIKPQNLEQYLGSKLASRLASGCAMIELKGGDKRYGSTPNSF